MRPRFLKHHFQCRLWFSWQVGHGKWIVWDMYMYRLLTAVVKNGSSRLNIAKRLAASNMWRDIIDARMSLEDAGRDDFMYSDACYLLTGYEHPEQTTHSIVNVQKWKSHAFSVPVILLKVVLFSNRSAKQVLSSAMAKRQRAASCFS